MQKCGRGLSWEGSGLSYRLSECLSGMRCKDKNYKSTKLCFLRVNFKTRQVGTWDLDKGRGESLVEEAFGIQDSSSHDIGRCGRQEEAVRPIYPDRGQKK